MKEDQVCFVAMKLQKLEAEFLSPPSGTRMSVHIGLPDGCVGALYAFTSIGAAKAFSGEDTETVAIRMKKENQ
jgi:hypothetical protein